MKHLRTVTAAQVRRIKDRSGKEVPEIIPSTLRKHQQFRVTTKYGTFTFEALSDPPRKDAAPEVKAWVVGLRVMSAPTCLEPLDRCRTKIEKGCGGRSFSLLGNLCFENDE